MDVVKRRWQRARATDHSGKENAAVTGRKAPIGVLLPSDAAGARCRQFFALGESARWRLRRVARRQHLIDQAVRLRLLRVHEEVAFHVGAYLLDRLAGAFGVDLVELLARLQDLTGVDLDVGRLPPCAARGL